jgi:hypothetical protein
MDVLNIDDDLRFTFKLLFFLFHCSSLLKSQSAKSIAHSEIIFPLKFYRKKHFILRRDSAFRNLQYLVSPAPYTCVVKTIILVVEQLLMKSLFIG